jgi:hypothetical protein
MVHYADRREFPGIIYLLAYEKVSRVNSLRSLIPCRSAPES